MGTTSSNNQGNIRKLLKQYLVDGSYKKNNDETFSKWLRRLPYDFLILMAQVNKYGAENSSVSSSPISQLCETIKIEQTHLSDFQEALHKEFTYARADLKRNFEKQLGKLNHESSKEEESETELSVSDTINRLLFIGNYSNSVDDISAPHKEPKNEALLDAYKNDKLIELPEDIEKYLKAKTQDQGSTAELYKEITAQHINELIEKLSGAKEKKETKIPNRPTPPNKTELLISKTLRNNSPNPYANAIDKEIILSILPQPDITQKNKYAGLIHFDGIPRENENTEIRYGFTKPHNQESGIVDFEAQLKTLVAQKNDAESFTADFVVARNGRKHFSTLSVTIENGKITTITHTDTTDSEDNIKKKLEETITGVVSTINNPPTPSSAATAAAGGGEGANTHQAQYKYKEISNQKTAANLCGDHVILTMLQKHGETTLNKLLDSFFKEPIKIEGDSTDARVTHLLKPANKALLRQFTCHIVKNTEALKEKVGFIQEADDDSNDTQTSFKRGRDTWYSPEGNKKTHEEMAINKWFQNSLSALNNQELFGQGTPFRWTQEENSFGEPSITFDDNTRTTSVTLWMKKDGNQEPINIKLIRKEEEIGDQNKKTPVVTWRCNASNLSEEDRYKIIAVQSLQLRLANMSNNPTEAKRIGIVELPESQRGTRNKKANEFFKPNSAHSKGDLLSQNEINLIKAHFQAGYEQVEYRDVLYTGLAPKANPASSLTSTITQFNPTDATATENENPSKGNKPN
jgi:hypothetical protein